jgi:hypothetical protein
MQSCQVEVEIAFLTKTEMIERCLCLIGVQNIVRGGTTWIEITFAEIVEIPIVHRSDHAAFGIPSEPNHSPPPSLYTYQSEIQIPWQ